MDYLIDQCIVLIMDGIDDVGQGFFADGYFITAAHVVKQFPECYIDIEGNKLKLSELPLVLKGDIDVRKDEHKVDVSIYRYDRASPLHLSTYKPQKDDILKCYRMALCQDPMTGKYYKKIIVERAYLLEKEEGNYIYCVSKLYFGSSGCPLLFGNQVVGVMHGGDGSIHLCAFLKPESFMFSPEDNNSNACKIAGYNTTDYNPYEYNHNAEARKLYGDAFDGGEEDCISYIR